MSHVQVAAELKPSPLSLRRAAVAPARALLDLAEAAPATLLVLIAMAAVWVVEREVIGQVHGGRTIGYLAVGALPNADIPGRGNPGEWWRYVTSGLVHDTSSPVHLFGNGIALLAVGGAIERVYGRLVMVATLVFGVVMGGVAWMVASSLDLVAEPDYTVGCSAGICALIGLMLVYGYRERNDILKERAVAMRSQAALGIALMLLLGMVVANLNNVAHAGGLVCGATIGLLLPTRAVGGRAAVGWRLRIAATAMIAVWLVAIGFAAQNLLGRLSA